MTLLGHLNCAARGLHEWLDVLLDGDPGPIVVFQVEIDDIVSDSSVLILASKDYHGAAVDGCAVIFARLHAHTFGLEDVERARLGVVDHDLRRAFPDLSLSIIHVAASEHIDLILENACRVSAPPLDLFVRSKVHILPARHVIVRSVVEFGDLAVCVVVLATDEEGSPVAVGEGRVFSRSWQPFVAFDRDLGQLSVERLPFLHPLHVGLQAPRQLLRELVPRYVFRWLSRE